jgi:hypothetical protein
MLKTNAPVGRGFSFRGPSITRTDEEPYRRTIEWFLGFRILNHNSDDCCLSPLKIDSGSSNEHSYHRENKCRPTGPGTECLPLPNSNPEQETSQAQEQEGTPKKGGGKVFSPARAGNDSEENQRTDGQAHEGADFKPFPDGS